MLWQDGVQVPLTPRVFDILCTLVQRHGELVTKDDFMRLVWGGVAVEDNNLARQISTLRKLLHERPGQREYIVTVTGVGYRFVGSVTVSDDLQDDPATLAERARPAVAPADPAPSAASAEASAGRREATAATVAAAAVPAGDPLADVLPAVGVAPAGAAPEPSLLVSGEHGDHAHRRAVGTTARRWSPLVFGGVAAVALVALMVWPDRPTTAAAVSRTLSQFTHGSGSQFDPAWSPDGSRLALASDRNGNADIWVHGLANSSAIQLTTSNAHDWQPSWSPDGRAIVFRSERDGGGIYVTSASGGAERRLTTFGSRPQWSPTADAILFTHAAPDSAVAVKLFTVPASGGTPERVVHPALAGLQVTNAAWAPDGRVSVWTRDEVGGRQFITLPLDGGEATRSAVPPEFSTLSGPTQLSNFVWSASGRHIYFEGRTRSVRNVWRVTVQPVTLNWIGGPEQVTLGPGADVGLTVSPDGGRLAFGVNTARPGIWSFGFDARTGQMGAEGHQVISGTSGERGGDVTADGVRVAYRLDRDNRQEIWVRGPDSEPALVVSESGWDVSVPRWSPDQRRIVYQRRSRPSAGVAERRSVMLLDVSTPGSRPVELYQVPPGQQALPTDWRPDGRAILTACRVDVALPAGICEMPLPDPSAGQTAVRQSQLAVDERRSLYQQRYSPDMRWISFMAVPRADRSASALYVMPAAGGPWRQVTDGQDYDDKPRWSPDGRILYFISNRGGRFEVWGRRFDPDAGLPVGAAFQVTSFEGARLALSPYLTDMEMFVTADRLMLPMFEASSRVWLLDQADR